jgi:hypothetical protein
MDWYTPNAYTLDRGDEILPVGCSTRIHVANSHKLAVACWRYWRLVYPQSKLTYYRVQPYSRGGEPTPVDEIPGLFVCRTVEIIETVADGSGYPEGEKYSDEELWPLIKMTTWPDGRPLYNSEGFIVNQPILTPTSELDREILEGMLGLHYLLPFFIKSHVESHSTFRFGYEWPRWDWKPG